MQKGSLLAAHCLGAINSARYLVVQNQASAFSHRFSFTLYFADLVFGQRWPTLHDSWLHDGLNLLLNKHSLFLCCGMLILLVLRNKVIHVALGLGKLLLVQALTSVPVKERFTSEHGSEELCGTLELVLNGRGSTQESNCTFESLRRDIKDGGPVVLGNPLHEVR